MKDSRTTRTKPQLKVLCLKNEDLSTLSKSNERKFILRPQTGLVSRIIILVRECLELLKAFLEGTDQTQTSYLQDRESLLKKSILKKPTRS